MKKILPKIAPILSFDFENRQAAAPMLNVSGDGDVVFHKNSKITKSIYNQPLVGSGGCIFHKNITNHIIDNAAAQHTTGIGPFDIIDAIVLREGTGISSHGFSFKTSGLVTGDIIASSMYVKTTDHRFLQLRWYGGPTAIGDMFVNFDLYNLTWKSSKSPAVSNAFIEKLSGGWYRIGAICTVIGSATNQDFALEIAESLDSGRRPAFQGNPDKTCLIWRPQVERAQYWSPAIKYFAGSQITASQGIVRYSTSVLNNKNCTVVVKFRARPGAGEGSGSAIFDIADGTNSVNNSACRVAMIVGPDEVRFRGSYNMALGSSPITMNDWHTAAICIGPNWSRFAVDGVAQEGVAIGHALVNASLLHIGSNRQSSSVFVGEISNWRYYASVMSLEELAAITSNN